MTINVPERNRAVKKLLQLTYPGVKVSVKAGDGTAYHWIMIEFSDRVGLPKGMMHNRVTDAIEDLIVGAGIHISTYVGDGDYHGRCISIRMPHGHVHDWVTDETGLIDTCVCGEKRA